MDVVKQPGAFQEALVPGDAGEAGHDLVHAAILAGDVAVPHADARGGRHGLQALLHPESHALGDLERLPVPAHLVAVQQAGQDFVQRVVGSPDLVVAAAVGGALFQHDELVRRIGADESPAPVPVVRADALLAQVGIIVRSARSRRHGGRIRVAGAAFLGRPSGLLRQVVKRVDEVIHLLQEIGPQRGIVAGARVSLGDGGEIMSARMPAQPGRLGVPTAEGLDVLRLFLPEGVAEHVEETIGVGLGEALNELVAVLHERGRALLFVRVQGHAVQGKRFDGANWSRAIQRERLSR